MARGARLIVYVPARYHVEVCIGDRFHEPVCLPLSLQCRNDHGIVQVTAPYELSRSDIMLGRSSKVVGYHGI